MAINLIDKKTLFSYIGNCSNADAGKVHYWLSDWVDLSRFSQSTSIPVPELESIFIDSIVPINPRQTLSIKHCPECLRKGYHSVLFYLKVITYCPWHHRRLVFCRACSEAMSLVGPTPKRHEDVDEVSFSLRLSCGHFFFDSNLGYDLNYNDSDFYNTVCAYTSRILNWLKCVPRCSETASAFINFLYDGESQNELGFNHCVEICSTEIGRPPWVGSGRKGCRKIQFTPQAYERLGRCESLPVLKSIRRHLYRKHIKSHKKCFKTLLIMSRKDLHCLDIKCACSASSAMLGWMFALGYVLAGKSGGIQPFAIRLGGETPSTLKEVAVLWLSHFYGIWASIEHELDEALSHKGKFAISLSPRSDPCCVELSDHCVLITPSVVFPAAEFTIIVRDPYYLSLKSFQRCLGRLNTEKAVSPASTWTVYHWAYEFPDETIMRYWTNEATSERSHVRSVLLG